MIIRNVAREKLERGDLSLGCGVRLTRSVEIAIAMKAAGFDWLFLDNDAALLMASATQRTGFLRKTLTRD